jgi:two-component system alkaline phosphatase synthesis response regulator PhoP
MSEGAAVNSKRVLVINHERTIRDVLERFLRVDGYSILTAAECDEGLNKARLLPVKLIVLDVDLPMSNGLTVYARFKSDAVTARLPLLLVSSRLPKDELQKMAAGTDGFLTMPFSFTQVREAVSRLLGPAA